MFDFRKWGSFGYKIGFSLYFKKLNLKIPITYLIIRKNNFDLIDFVLDVTQN